MGAAVAFASMTGGSKSQDHTSSKGEISAVVLLRCLGDDAIELAQHIQVLLHKHNRPPVSLYKEMVER